ncbi:hypothetical protein FOZ61_005164 [Perkinsus olseni]|uniref:Uncharacterized protein n=1 Tax=Perkinsus olseni TaxID=32597 RepID=A0A7J6MBS8_PEROL|nr:hypothetical protein FOZ61_005164 [Perkinsus olseni]KAF4675471.1 hypothetical protein FOL46_001409 [Perkinsus olseni]
MVALFEEPLILETSRKPLRSEAATSAPPSPSVQEWLSVSEDQPPLVCASWDALHDGRRQPRRGIVRGFPVNALSDEEISRITKSVKFAVQGAASELFPCRTKEDRSLVCRCGLNECHLCWAPRAGNIVARLKGLELPREVREELDGILGEELLEFERESFAGIMSLARSGQRLCRILEALSGVFGPAGDDKAADIHRMSRLLRIIEQQQHSGDPKTRDQLLRLVKAYCCEPERRAEDAVRRRTVDLGGEWVVMPQQRTDNDCNMDAFEEYVSTASEPIGRLLFPIEDTLKAPVVVVGQAQQSVHSTPSVSGGHMGMMSMGADRGEQPRHGHDQAAVMLRLKKEKQEQFRRGLEAQIAEKRETVRRVVEEERLAQQERLLKEAQVRHDGVDEERKRLIDLAQQSERAAEAVEQLHSWRLLRIRKPKGLYKAVYHDDMASQIEELTRRPDRHLIQVGFGAAIDPLVARAKDIQQEFFFPPELRTNIAEDRGHDDGSPVEPYIRVWGPGGNQKPLPDHSDREAARSILQAIYAASAAPEVPDEGEGIAAAHKAGEGAKAAMDWSWLPVGDTASETQPCVTYKDIPHHPLDDRTVRRRSGRVVREVMASIYGAGGSSGNSSPTLLGSPETRSEVVMPELAKSYFVDPWPAEEGTSTVQGAYGSMGPPAVDCIEYVRSRGQRRSSIAGQMLHKREEERKRLLVEFDKINSRQ